MWEKEWCGMRTIAEVVEDIKNGTWGSDIEYQSECEKLHKLCDEILEIEKAKAKRIVAELEDLQCVNPFLTTTEYEHKAIEIARKGGAE